jgi:hypothetical protein
MVGRRLRACESLARRRALNHVLPVSARGTIANFTAVVVAHLSRITHSDSRANRAGE